MNTLTQSSTGDSGNHDDNGAGVPVKVLPVCAPPIVCPTQDQTSKHVPPRAPTRQAADCISFDMTDTDDSATAWEAWGASWDKEPPFECAAPDLNAGPAPLSTAEPSAEEYEQLRAEEERTRKECGPDADIYSEEDIISRLQREGVQIKISLRGPYGCGRDYSDTIRRLRKFPVMWTIFSAKRGLGLDVVADIYHYDSCDALLDDLEKVVQNHHSVHKKANKTRRLK